MRLCSKPAGFQARMAGRPASWGELVYVMDLTARNGASGRAAFPPAQGGGAVRWDVDGGPGRLEAAQDGTERIV